MRTRLKVALLLILSGASGAFAQTVVPLSVSGNEARGTITLPGDIGADLTIAFEEVVGLTPAAFDVSATLVNPLDLTLLGRLPTSGLVSVPGTFPVLVRIAPSEASALTFAGVAAIGLHTHDLQLDLAVPLAIFKSPDGGAFEDVTTAEGIGSYRVSGSSGGFSEFLVVVDGRPIDTIIAAKFDALQLVLTENAGAMPGVVATTLQTRLSQARTFYESGATVAAIGEMTAFSAYVKAHSGQDIPDVWRAHDPSRANVAGLLRAGADTLRFSLDRKESR